MRSVPPSPCADKNYCETIGSTKVGSSRWSVLTLLTLRSTGYVESVVATNGHFYWPPPGRNKWPLTTTSVSSMPRRNFASPTVRPVAQPHRHSASNEHRQVSSKAARYGNGIDSSGCSENERFRYIRVVVLNAPSSGLMSGGVNDEDQDRAERSFTVCGRDNMAVLPAQQRRNDALRP